MIAEKAADIIKETASRLLFESIIRHKSKYIHFASIYQLGNDLVSLNYFINRRQHIERTYSTERTISVHNAHVEYNHPTAYSYSRTRCNSQ